MSPFGGKVLFLDRDDINTDEIIPAKYLTEITRLALAPHLLEDLEIPGFSKADAFRQEVKTVVSRANFGCGSSREHAPWAFQVNGINLIVAENFARIFRQNLYNSGMLAVELPGASIDRLFKMAEQSVGGMTLTADPVTCLLKTRTDGDSETFAFTLNTFQQKLVLAGGWVDYASQAY